MQVAVERKSKEDAYQCVGASRERFERCLDRLSRLDRAAIVIEATLPEFVVPPPRTRITARMAVRSYLSWSCQFGIPVFWCGDRSYSQAVTLRWLLSFVKHRAETR